MTTAPGASRLVLQAQQAEIEAARRLAARAGVIDVAGQLIHALQRERGASTVWLASHGKRFADLRGAAVAEAVPVEAALRAALDDGAANGAAARTLSLMAWVLLGLDALADLRAQIERQGIGAHDAVAAYSRLIAGLVELVFDVADAALLPGVSRLLVALLHLVQGKEAAGQERAVGALLYASGTCTEAHRQRLLHLIDAQERSLQVCADFAEPGLRARWEQQQLAPATARLERLRRTLCAAQAGGAIDSNLADGWFEVCSERIGDLWRLEVDLVAQLRAACAARIDAAERELEDSEGLLRRLRENPPLRAHAVERFFDVTTRAASAPEPAAAAESTSLVELLQAQSARLASVEAELDAARRALDERKVIERAKGVLMARLGMTEEAAFRALQKTSMDQNRRLREVAEATLALPDFAFARIDPKAR